jgi:hypothetical protein
VLIPQIKRIATDKLREAFAEIPEANRRLNDPVPARGNRSDGDDSRPKGDLMAAKMAEK